MVNCMRLRIHHQKNFDRTNFDFVRSESPRIQLTEKKVTRFSQSKRGATALDSRKTADFIRIVGNTAELMQLRTFLVFFRITGVHLESNREEI